MRLVEGRGQQAQWKESSTALWFRAHERLKLYRSILNRALRANDRQIALIAETLYEVNEYFVHLNRFIERTLWNSEEILDLVRRGPGRVDEKKSEDDQATISDSIERARRLMNMDEDELRYEMMEPMERIQARYSEPTNCCGCGGLSRCARFPQTTRSGS